MDATVLGLLEIEDLMGWRKEVNSGQWTGTSSASW